MKKLKLSVEAMPRPAYIFLKYMLLICCAMLVASLLLFLSPDGMRASGWRYHLAILYLESPAGVLLLGGVCLAFILDRQQT